MWSTAWAMKIGKLAKRQLKSLEDILDNPKENLQRFMEKNNGLSWFNTKIN